MEKGTLKTRASEKMEEWKKEVDQLKNQLQHNTEDAKSSFEKQKANLLKWTDEMKHEFEKVEGIGEEKAKTFKGNLEDLRVQAALGKMDSLDAWHDQQKKMNHSIHNMRNSIAKMEKDAAGNAKALLQQSNYTLDGYQTKFEMYRLQLIDGKEGAVQSWNDRKKDITLRLEKLSNKLEEGKTDAAEKWDGFSKEMGEAWSHFKKALHS